MMRVAERRIQTRDRRGEAVVTIGLPEREGSAWWCEFSVEGDLVGSGRAGGQDSLQALFGAIALARDFVEADEQVWTSDGCVSFFEFPVSFGGVYLNPSDVARLQRFCTRFANRVQSEVFSGKRSMPYEDG